MKWRDIAAHLASRDDEFLDTECKVLVDDDGIRKEASAKEIVDGGLMVSTIKHRWLVHWKDHSTDEFCGYTFASAFNNAGYGAGAVGAIDECELIDE